MRLSIARTRGVYETFLLLITAFHIVRFFALITILVQYLGYEPERVIPSNIAHTLNMTLVVTLLVCYHMLHSDVSDKTLNKGIHLVEKAEHVVLKDRELSILNKTRAGVLERGVFYFLVALCPLMIYQCEHEVYLYIATSLKLAYTLCMFIVELALAGLSLKAAGKLFTVARPLCTDLAENK